MQLGELIDHGLVTAGADAEALTDGRVSLTWAEYRDLVARLAGRLRRAGVDPGERVAVHLPKSVDSFVAVHAILRAGAVMVPLDWFASPDYLRSVIDDAEPVALLTRARATTIDEVVAGTTVAHVLDPTVDPAGDDDPIDAVPVAGGDPAYIIYTSGSTGRPKGIVHTHDSAIAYAALAAETYDLGAADRLANIAPLQFDQSTFELYSAPLVGAAVLVVPDGVMRFPASLATLVAEERITIWYSVPHALRQMVVRGAIEQHDFSALRWILYGGEVYPPDELGDLMRAIPSARISNVYGPAEVNQCMFHHLDEPPAADSPVPIGRAWPGARIALLDADGLVDGPGTGELWVASATMMDRYWNRADLTGRSVLHDHPALGAGPWYRSGDLVERRADGEIVFIGRVDNQIKLRGYRIELEAVEAAVVGAGGVDGCAAVVDEGGEQIVAIVDPVLDEHALERVARRRGAACPAMPFPAGSWRSIGSRAPVPGRSTAMPPGVCSPARRFRLLHEALGSVSDSVSLPAYRTHTMTILNSDHDLLARDLVTFIDAEVSAGFEPVEADTDLMMSGLVDSLGVVLIVDWIENRLGIQVDPGDVVLENFISVDAMVSYLVGRGDVGA